MMNVVLAVLVLTLSFGVVPVSAAETAPVSGTYEVLGASRSKQATLDQKLALLPDGVLEKLQEAGWTIQMSNPTQIGQIIGAPGYYAGITVENQKVIFLSNAVDDAEWCVIHELGHAVAFETRRPDLDDTFRAVMAAESQFAQLENSAYMKRDPMEYWGECFKMRFENPAALANCPQTVAYIDSVVAQFVAD